MNLRPKPLLGLARFFGLDSLYALVWVFAGCVVVLGLFLTQYGLYGYDRYLGWDTSTYVQLARQIQVYGPGPAMGLLGYPSLYVYLDWAFGSLVGNIAAGERVLPVLMGMILVGLYFRLGREVFAGKPMEYAGVTALLAALVPNTMRLLSDLHRNLFALIAVLSALVVLAEMMDGRRSRRSAVIWIAVLGALAAYSEIETYAVFLAVVAIYGVLELKRRWPAIVAAAAPLLVAAPFLIQYFESYVRYAAVRNPADPPLSLGDFVYFHGGLLPLVPLAVLGGCILLFKARHSPFLPRILCTWYAVLLALVPALWLYNGNLPPYRPLYLLPVPILLMLGIDGLVSGWARSGASPAAGKTTTELPPAPGPRRRPTVAFAILAAVVMVGAAGGLAAQKDLYMQPFISEQIYNQLVQVGQALEPYAVSTPLLVFDGYNGTWYYSIEQAYVGSLSGPNAAYFGRPQFLLSMTDPLVAQPMLMNDPNPSRFVASQIFKGDLAGGLDASNVATHPIVVAAAGLYDRPISDYVVLKHVVSPGLYLIPPNSVTDLDRDTWMWFAAYDWQYASPFGLGAASWAIAPRILGYSTPALDQPWNITYLMDLATPRANATLSIHLEDSPVFPPAWNVSAVSAGGFTILVDHVAVAPYTFGGRGTRWANYSLGPLAAGYHVVELEADQLGRPFSLQLDAVAFCPRGISLPTVLAAYGA